MRLERICARSTYDLPNLWLMMLESFFSSKKFVQNAKLIGIQTQMVPLKSHNSNGEIEYYHRLQRKACEMIFEELKSQRIRREVLLQMAVMINDDSEGSHIALFRAFILHQSYGVHYQTISKLYWQDYQRYQLAISNGACCSMKFYP